MYILSILFIVLGGLTVVFINAAAGPLSILFIVLGGLAAVFINAATGAALMLVGLWFALFALMEVTNRRLGEIIQLLKSIAPKDTVQKNPHETITKPEK